MTESAQEQLERIERNQKAMVSATGGNMRLISAGNLDSLLTHARRSVEAEAAENEVKAAAEALWNMGGDEVVFSAAGPLAHELHIAMAETSLSAAALYRAAHPAPTVINASSGPGVTLADCPIGLFRCHDELCVKTEYGNNEGRINAYIVSSGEFFWGGHPQTIANQRAQIVYPIGWSWDAAHPAPVVIDTVTGALLTPIDDLLKIVEEEVGVYDTCADEPDDSSVGYGDGGDLPMTFGHVRRARKAIAALTAALNPQEPTP